MVAKEYSASKRRWCEGISETAENMLLEARDFSL